MMQHVNSNLEIETISESQVRQSLLMFSGTTSSHNNVRRHNFWIISLGFKMKGCIKLTRSKIVLCTDRIRLRVTFSASSSVKEQSNLKQALSDFPVIPKVFCKHVSSLNFNVVISDKSFLGIISFSAPQVVKNLVRGNTHDTKSGTISLKKMLSFFSLAKLNTPSSM